MKPSCKTKKRKHPMTLNKKELDLHFACDHLIRNEVYLCVSHFVSMLAQGYGESIRSSDLTSLCEQAAELFAPILDYEEAAIQEGWTGPHQDKFGATYFEDTTDGQTWTASNWDELCNDFDIEPYEREVFEHWAVSEWLTDKLIAKGEKVDKDFASMCVWARTTTGQAISMDSVIEQICKETYAK